MRMFNGNRHGDRGRSRRVELSVVTDNTAADFDNTLSQLIHCIVATPDLDTLGVHFARAA